LGLRVIPVLDILNGQAVRARGGVRNRYQPVVTYLCARSDPVELACSYQEKLGCDELYLADLDAIQGAPANSRVIRELCDRGFHLWVDAGVTSPRRFNELLAAGVSRPIVATETLPAPPLLDKLARDFARSSLVFGLDLRGGKPLLPERHPWEAWSAIELATRVHALGIERMLVMELTRIGTGEGLGAIPVVERIARRLPTCELAIGGGVSAMRDLMTAARAGAAAVLVGSALLDGRLTREDLDHLSAVRPADHSRSTTAD
jgi:phosphoribosylformimino-5-aminoimidazole carboxamide ribotide isomerase